MKKNKRKDTVANTPSLFERTLATGYKIAFIVFSLWLGWVVVDEVQMQRGAVSTMARVYDVDYIPAYQLAEQGKCYRTGRMANCRERYTFTVDYLADGQRRTAQFSDIAWDPGSSKEICIKYVQGSADIIKLCHAGWFRYHKGYIGFPIAFWALTLMGAASIAATVALDKLKQRLCRPAQSRPKERWYRVYDQDSGSLLLETNNISEINKLLHQYRIFSCHREANSNIVELNGRKTERDWTIYQLVKRRPHRQKKSKTTARSAATDHTGY